MAVSDVERQPVIPVDGSPQLSTSREYQKDSARPGPAAASLCGALSVQIPRSAGTMKHRILLLQVKKPTSFNSLNLDSPTNSKEALERLLGYKEKGKMLKERLLTQDKESSLGSLHAGIKHTLGRQKCKFWVEDKAPQLRYIPGTYQKIILLFQALFLLLLVPMQSIQMRCGPLQGVPQGMHSSHPSPGTHRKEISAAWLV